MFEDEVTETEEEIMTEELTDLAFGMFTIFMEQQLEKEQTCLYREVEAGADLTDRCASCLPVFEDAYPPLVPALSSLGTAADIAGLYAAGEGIVPTKTTRSYWIQQDRPGVATGVSGAEEAGKWLIFLLPEDVDAAWQKVRNAMVLGTLGIGAKVSTAKENEDSRDERKVIYVFTENWADEADVMRVREELKQLGFVDRIGYKRNLDTYAGEYREKGKRVTYYSV
ncbi:putative phosphothreonine lyase domain-containg protein [Methanorbis rubei]|uniref:DUF1917 domain-containing protein n=1 Tax=Methanorbis rubei TaxID=3028300 RepID=A0AAE4MHJ7_9EURY|nr:hypothetical protein [Methanocorpusculaceae archaeon Cs1]